MSTYYRGRFSDWLQENFSIYERIRNKIIRRSFDKEYGPIKVTYELDSQKCMTFLHNNKCVEIENGEKLCKDFDALLDSWNHMVDSYDRMFKTVLNG